MHTAMMLSFQDELEKIASHAAELTGLGILAAPSLGHMAGKEWSEKNKARAEVGGLGVLAAPSAVAVGKKAVSKGKAVLRAANVKKIRDAAVGVAKHAGVKDVAKRIYHSDKALHRTEGFAAGTLSAVGAKALGDKLKKKREDRLKKEAAPSMSAMMNMHRLADAAKAAKGAVKPAAQAAVKMPSQAAHAARAQQLAGHAATGGHAWNPAAQAKRAIPL